ncbi:MAG: acyl-ACP--UDP-N-acetylglucosamine O-acyltransferase [Pseudomonadota bacterium]
MTSIHPTAEVDAKAQLGADVAVGPYCVVGPGVSLDEGVVLEAHVVMGGETAVGPRSHIFPFASIGLKPQDLKYRGEATKLVIGADNQIREHVTMNPGTAGGGGLTQVGNGCLFMVGAHVAHDCQIGDSVIMANNATLGGHVVIEDFAIIGGLAAIHQFVRIGRHAMVGGMSGVEQDVIPFGSVMGERAHLSGLNLVGLKRHDFTRDDIHALRTAYRLLFADEGTLSERLDDVEDVLGESSPVRQIIDFMKLQSQRGVCQPRDGHAA